MAREGDDTTASASNQNGGVDGEIWRAGRAQGNGADGGPTALDALKRMVRGSFELARDLPCGGACLFGEPRSEQATGPTTFEMISRHVRAAQRAGELKAADAFLMTVLILGSVVGAADLIQYVRAGEDGSINEGECPPLLLLDLLTTKTCN